MALSIFIYQYSVDSLIIPLCSLIDTYIDSKVLEHLRPWLSQIEVQRLQQKFHPWKSVSYEAARSRARDYEGLIEAEKLYILEVERILERVAGRRTDMF